MYEGFAEVYDLLTQDIDYVKWADFMESAFLTFGRKPKLVLELGCGTGSLAIELAGRGYEMIGLDSSSEMLQKASDKARSKGRDILFIQQDMREFELYGTVDAVICALDSINYITDKRDLMRVFNLVRNYLNPGGLFIFDVNSPYKLSHILGNETFFEMGDDVTWIWNNTYDARKKLCYFDLTFFIRDSESGLYRKVEESHAERAWTSEEIAYLLEKAGMEAPHTFGELHLKKPHAKEQRIFYISSKETPR